MKRKNFFKVLGAAWTGFVLACIDAPRLNAGAPPRKPVIPIEVIKEFRMEPAKEYGFTVKGEDGQDYSIDDCLRTLFDISQQHWRRALRK